MNANRELPANRCMPLAEWPARDRAAWEAAFQPTTVGAYWSEATKRMVQTGYGRWLTHLGEQQLIDGSTPAAARVTDERISSYIAVLRVTINDFTVAARIEQLGNAMRVIVPDRHWHRLQHIADKIRAAARRQREQASVAPLACGERDQTASDRCKATHSGLPLGQWPAADQAAWAAALTIGDALDPGGLASRWAPATQRIAEEGYGYWVAWLAERDALDPKSSPATRVTRDQLRIYAGEMDKQLAPFTVVTRIQQVGNAMRAMAPEQDWRWVQRAADRLRACAVPVRNKRARLQSPEQLVALGVQANGKSRRSGQRQASRTRCSVSGWLADRLPRATSGPRPQSHLDRLWLAPGAPQFRLVAGVLRNRDQDRTADRISPASRAIRRVVALHGGVSASSPRSWSKARSAGHGPVGIKAGFANGVSAIAHQVRQHTKAAFGQPLSPHLFRDCLATGVAIAAPTKIYIIPILLGPHHTGHLGTPLQSRRQHRGRPALYRHDRRIAQFEPYAD